eukprot:TRINITY_DN15960_c0_g3_i2.p1 TRINITY_DN15960_c0_g3~~TRINITY_DN15960_c0_g3_i2.p1  ORF type:complete len:394 (+),score=54.35 TRINITY_DN15960_c0_g3_i2:1125-2306(+)
MITSLAEWGCRSVYASRDRVLHRGIKDLTKKNIEQLARMTAVWGMGTFNLELIKMLDDKEEPVGEKILFPALTACAYGNSETELLGLCEKITNREEGITKYQQTHLSNCLLLNLTRKSNSTHTDTDKYLSAMVDVGAEPTLITFKILMYLCRSDEDRLKGIAAEARKAKIEFTRSQIFDIRIASSQSFTDALAIADHMRVDGLPPTEGTISGLLCHCRSFSDLKRTLLFAVKSNASKWPNTESLEVISFIIKEECSKGGNRIGCVSLLDSLIKRFEEQYPNWPLPAIVLGNRVRIYSDLIPDEVPSVRAEIASLGYLSALPHGRPPPRPFVALPLLSMCPFGRPLVFPPELKYLASMPEHQSDILRSFSMKEKRKGGNQPSVRRNSSKIRARR